MNVSSPKEVNNLTIVNATIVDETWHIQGVFWNNTINQIKQHRSFKFTNMSVRQFNGQTSITSTVDTTITEIEQLNNVVGLPEEKLEYCTVDTVEVNHSKNCLFL